MIKQIIILASVMAFAIAEAPLSGPYPPSGWKPTGAAFTLPKEFLPQPQAGGAEVEITKERVEYTGQLGETTTVEPSNGYLPPDEPEETDDNSTEDYLKVQGLPSNERRPPFNQQQPQSGELNTGEYRVPAAPARNQYRSQDSQKFGQNRQQQGSQQQFAQNRQQQQQFGQFRQGAQQQQQQQFRPQPRQFNQQPQQFNNPQAQQFNQQPQQFNQQPQQFNQQPQQFNPQQQQFNQQPQQFNPQQQQFNPQPQQFNSQPQQFNPQPQQFNPEQPQFGARRTPTQKYGPPTPNPDAQEDDETDDTTNASNEDSQEDGQPAVAVSNSIANGRYYVLTPDNTLQRVVFSTTQDEDEARTNGFTAQLRYMPVEPIRDPIYAYNEQGQLIRIFKK